MPRLRVRRVDFSPGDWIGGTLGMTLEEEGLYIRLVTRIYNHGGPIPSDRAGLAHLCGVRPQVMRRVLDRLIAMGKFDETSGKLTSNRCETELKLAANRIETAQINGAKGGRPNGLDKPDGSPPSKANLPPPITNLDSEAKASAAEAANGHDDLAAEVFSLGVRILTRRGVPERQARSIIGGHRKTLHDDAKLLTIMASVERNNPVEPIGYLAKAVAQAVRPDFTPFGSPGFA